MERVCEETFQDNVEGYGKFFEKFAEFKDDEANDYSNTLEKKMFERASNGTTNILNNRKKSKVIEIIKEFS
jgi:hypothetical protein